MDYQSISSLWDLAQAPSQFSQLPDDDFLAFLQKQFPSSLSELSGASPNDGNVNPQSIHKVPLPGLTPPSDDSSPSPPSNNDSLSRRQSVNSRGNDEGDSTLKRKASVNDLEEGPSSKTQHTADDSSSTKKGQPSRRKSTGNAQDESRLLKRKEQNRAAQRAFRERKEKHVKDLEDKVAALEAKNEEAQTENTNLRDLLSRLQQENLALKQSQFTFSIPKPAAQTQPPTPASTSQHSTFSFFNTASTPTAGPSRPSPKAAAFGGEIDWGSLTTFDPSMLNLLDEPSEHPMQVDHTNSPFGQYALPPRTQYKTIANNPLLMSFADSPEITSSTNASPSSANAFEPFSFNLPSPSNLWNSAAQPSPFTSGQVQNDFLHQSHSLDDLFGGSYLGNQGPMDYSVLMENGPLPAASPVSHANGSEKPSPQNSIPSPPSAHSTSSPSSTSTSNGQSPFSWSMPATEESPPLSSETTGPVCRTLSREAFAKVIAAEGDSPFTNPPAIHKANDFNAGNIVSCKGSTLPRTEESPDNIEVLKAWRTITSNPHFKKDADINELCTEFSKKARCDGTKVVLEPQGVHHIIETFQSKKQQQPQEQQSQQLPSN
ncbi:hypothetical protein F5I97DRAFT_1930229 [Phlebopus sp. FC_14]|nr:hypothetical protein F5I97DRAFT_1930229 [Phlebopus sp. FC_14]